MYYHVQIWGSGKNAQVGSCFDDFDGQKRSLHPEWLSKPAVTVKKIVAVAVKSEWHALNDAFILCNYSLHFARLHMSRPLKVVLSPEYEPQEMQPMEKSSLRPRLVEE